MPFDLNPFTLIILALVAFFIFGPERLPQMISDGVRTIRKLRDLAHDATSDLKAQLPDELKEIDLDELRELHPRNLAKSILTDDVKSALDPRTVTEPVLAAAQDAARSGSAAAASLTASAKAASPDPEESGSQQPANAQLPPPIDFDAT